MYVYCRMLVGVRRQLARTCENLCTLYVMWVLGIELRLLGLAVRLMLT